MDQSETQHLLRLPVLDCPQFDADLREFVQAKRMPTAAELAAKVLAAHAPPTQEPAPVKNDGPLVGRTAVEMRAEIDRIYSGRPKPSAELQWEQAPQIVRRMLVSYAGLRESCPGPSVQALADRAWQEMPGDEQRAIAQAVRVVMRDLTAMHCIFRES